MEMWDGSLPMYAQGEAENQSLEVVVGSKIIITKPDRSTIEKNVVKGDIGKIVSIHTDGSFTRILAFNPKWNCLEDGLMRGFDYDGLFIVLWREEFDVLDKCEDL